MEQFLGFFLWAHPLVKSAVYKVYPTSLEDLRQRIIDECKSILSEIFQKVQLELENCLYYSVWKEVPHILVICWKVMDFHGFS